MFYVSRQTLFNCNGLPVIYLSTEVYINIWSEILRAEAAQVNSPSHEEDFDDVGCNADLYASRQDAFQGSSRGSDERSQQQNDPHCFQSLSLD